MPRKQGICSRRAAQRKKEERKKAALGRQKATKSAQEAPALAGYRELGWREICSADAGLPHKKPHVYLVASGSLGAVVDSCLFSSVRLPAL